MNGTRSLTPLDIRLTDQEFHDMHVALDKVRSTSKTVTVNKAALTAILMDHSDMVGDLFQ